MTEDSHRSRQELCDAILLYLQTHPQAADSLEGVARWWVRTEGPPPIAEEVLEALDLLVDAGHIARLSLADGRTLYQSVDRTSGRQATIPTENP